MVLPYKIKKGVKIRNSLGGHFDEMKMLRKGIWALAVLMSPEEFTTEELNQAKVIKSQLLDIHNNIEGMK